LKKQISRQRAILIFVGFTLYFYLLLYTLLPLLKANSDFNPAVYWFITGYFLFVPIFGYAVLAVRKSGKLKDILEALNIRPFSKRDWRYAVGGLLSTVILSGLIYGIAGLLHKYAGTGELDTTPWFMEMNPFIGQERLLLLVWLPMFFFNICGEELLWRGYIQSRLAGKYSWLLCSGLWLIFHFPFGYQLVIILIPVILVIPYTFMKSRNTLVGVFIHGLFNGPIFIAVALGLIS
jgi:membrane protease YdiL (CAAX protease family)